MYSARGCKLITWPWCLTEPHQATADGRGEEAPRRVSGEEAEGLDGRGGEHGEDARGVAGG